jgi:delta-aminolevulinic acid dehydratase/porphobilinogen synthase
LVSTVLPPLQAIEKSDGPTKIPSMPGVSKMPSRQSSAWRVSTMAMASVRVFDSASQSACVPSPCLGMA